jgi:cell division protease FtsH
MEEEKNPKNGPDPKKNLDRKVHFSIWYLVAGLFIVSVIHNLYFNIPSVRSVPYSDFKQWVGTGEVEEVILYQQMVRGKLKEGSSHVIKGDRDFEVVRVEDPDLLKDLEKAGVKFSGKIEDTRLKDLFFAWILPFAILFLVWSFILRRFNPGAGVMSFGKSRAKLYAKSETGITFDDVAGIDEAKEELKEIVEFLKTPAKFKKIGGKIPKGVLLVGAPGTGKTLLARALAGEAKVPFFSLSGSDFVEMFVGVGAARVRDLFEQAQSSAPCIVFIDEIDAIGRARGVGVVAPHEEREQTLNQLLAQMDGFDPNSGVIVVAATNRPEILDPALLRPGRFDRHVAIDKPDLKGREEILKVHAKKVKLAKDVDLKVIAQRTAGFVGADLANIINEAALLAARKDRSEISMAEFESAIDRVIAGLEKKSRVMNRKEKEITAYHEAGHAVVAMSVKGADPVHKVTIIPRGIGALGFTLQLPTEDRYLMTRSELLDKIAVLLGGRMAEKMIFDEVSTGAENDLKRATDIVKSMVKDYGMSEKLGLVTFEKDRRAMFLDTVVPSQHDYSEGTAQEIDREVHRIMEDESGRVGKILLEKKDKLKKLAGRLLEKEVVEKEELQEIFSKDENLPSQIAGS